MSLHEGPDPPGVISDGHASDRSVEALAEQLAHQHRITPSHKQRLPLRKYLRELKAFFNRIHQILIAAPEDKLALSYASEWFLDNFYIMQQTLQQIHEDLPKGYYRKLPTLHNPPGYPRIYLLAQEIVKNTPSPLDIELVALFLRVYQRRIPLTMGELWALPIMLRLSILEIIAQALANLTGESMPDLPAIQLDPSTKEDNRVATGIINLHKLKNQDWKAFFESVSCVERILRRDAAKVYTDMNFKTRDRYRGIVEELASLTHQSETTVAKEAVKLSRTPAKKASPYSNSRTHHVGFYLTGEGRPMLEASLNYHPTTLRKLQRWADRHRTAIYLGSIALFTSVLMVLIVAYIGSVGGTLAQALVVSVLGLAPATTISINLINNAITHTIPPRVLPKMAFEKGIPAPCQTMVVIPALVTDIEEITSLLKKIELHYLGNTDPHLTFALLTDFPDAQKPEMSGEDALLKHLKSGIEELNQRYHRDSPPFYLFHRTRQWNPGEGCWMGWERKRGKLVEFNRLLSGNNETSYTVALGALDILKKVKYVITLDADTLLPPGSAKQLIATLAHPLNQAEFDPNTNTVITGYTVLQPRISITLASANQSRFSQIFSGDTGIDLYSRAVSDVYQDFFGEGIYIGKGIYDVAAFERSLRGRVPDNRLLSHDLFEGIHGRAALVTDIVFYEDYPPYYLAYTGRLHRWVRGDWQLLPWLFGKVPNAKKQPIENKFSLLNRWKILDNLRRSLMMPLLLALFIVGWLWLPGSPWVWTVLGVVTLGITFFMLLATDLQQYIRTRKTPVLTTTTWNHLYRWLMALCFLPYEGLIMLDAIATTLVRTYISHKRMLQWKTAAHTITLFGKERKVKVTLNRMIRSPLLAVILTILLAFTNLTTLQFASPLILAWLFAPWIAHKISQPLVYEPTPLSPGAIAQLRVLARRTWLYFEHFVGPKDHWLPPDHFQEDPKGLIAHRTSPTNVGLLLLSTLSAYDLGHINLVNLTLRLRATFESMAHLERHRGHFLNWYDTNTLTPLPPRYISTVDSGNLAAALIAFQQGCQAIPDTPILRQERWQSLLDALAILTDYLNTLELQSKALSRHLNDLRREVKEAQSTPEKWSYLLQDICTQLCPKINHLMEEIVKTSSQELNAEALASLQVWTERIHAHLQGMQDETSLLLPWLFSCNAPPELFVKADNDIQTTWQKLKQAFPRTANLNEIPGICRQGQAVLTSLREQLAQVDSADHEAAEAQIWCERLDASLTSARLNARSLSIAYHDLREKAESYIRDMDFKFLLDTQRLVFHIGYNLEAEKLDENYYDLLASEARLASLVAIATGEIPQSHWMHMHRPITQLNGRQGLLSWSGTMFEYLMPILLMQDHPTTLLGQSIRASIEHQITYARQKGVPWGISESAYYHFDAAMNYQYKAFGVPGLGIKRGLGEDLVITPYASLLSLPVAPQAVMQNLTALSNEGLLGRYGFYEAADYTQSRLPTGQQKAIVKSYFVHHQGMILLSLNNYLMDDLTIKRFHADPRIQSVALLLQEQAPERIVLEHPSTEALSGRRPEGPEISFAPWKVPMDLSMLQGHTLSNGRYGLFITNTGSGFSWWKSIALTRWRADATLDNWGCWLYIEDLDNEALLSAGIQPAGTQAANQEVHFSPHYADFHYHNHDLSLHTVITLSPEDDVEIRKLTLTNHSASPRRLRITSYGEVILTNQANDQQHPAFSKLFIESAYIPTVNGLLFHRRPRSKEERFPCLLHALIPEKGLTITGAYESDRARFLGRGGSPRSPAVLQKDNAWLSQTSGVTLDPIMALGQEVTLLPHAAAQIAFITCVAASNEKALAIANHYQSWFTIEQTFRRAKSHQEAELHRLNLGSDDPKLIQQLGSALFYSHPALRASPAHIAANRRGQSGLWPFAISGDYPILLVKMADKDELSLLKTVLRAHAYWRSQHLKIDLVILNEKESGYNQELHGTLYRLIEQMDADTWLNQRGGIFLLRADQMQQEERTLLETVARVILHGDKGSASRQLIPLSTRPTRLPPFIPMLSAEKSPPTAPLKRPTPLLFDNGIGGFTANGKEYCIYLNPGQKPPQPWINVIANPTFGFLISESGGGYTWSENSGENRLTPWHNDPVTDSPGEVCYLRDEETGEIWSPTPQPVGAPTSYLIRYGAGYAIFEHHSHGLKQHYKLFAAPDTPVKIIRVQLENTWQRPRRITATYYAEWVLGKDHATTQLTCVPEFNPATGSLLARNAYNTEFGERIAFLSASQSIHGFTCDRTEFLGERGSLACPAALRRIGLASAVKAGMDPCAALQVHINLNPGERKVFHFLLGQGSDRKETESLIQRYKNPQEVQNAWDQSQAFWEKLLSTITIETPDQAMNILLNHWVLYQTLACRIWGRSALYQSSGAFGYRDQLQDIMALVYAQPEIARNHILNAARHQFAAGDVLHWWHPPSGRGVRTRYSDDLLWLPFVTAQYVEATGDTAFMDKEVPFLQGYPLNKGEVEHYDLYPATEKSATLFEHCQQAIKKGATSGPHDLPLMGGGDWNDGMNRVGIKGQGESIWLGWFLYATLTRFAMLCRQIGKEGLSQHYQQRAKQLQEALEAHTWDGSWYLRAYYDDGTPLGSSQNKECQIDAIAQSWAILSDAHIEAERAAKAMAAVADRLISPTEQLIRIFTPPFDKTPHDPGYIRAYPPGIRENGGQYTHAAIWTAWAYAKLGKGDQAAALFRLLNPINHGDSAEKILRYQVEPYIVAADIYSTPPYVGRGGWTWYTGSAGWLYRFGIEAILGLKTAGRTFTIQPCIPKLWPGYTLKYRHGKTTTHIHVENPQGVNCTIVQVTLDGTLVSKEAIPCLDDGQEHHVHVLMG